MKAGLTLSDSQNLTRYVLILGGMWSAAEEERGRLEHCALQRLSKKGGGGAVLLRQTEGTNCTNYNWQWYDVTNFSNSDVSPRARAGPALHSSQPFFPGEQFHSDVGQQGLVIGSFGESSPLLGSYGLQPHSILCLLLQTKEI